MHVEPCKSVYPDIPEGAGRSAAVSPINAARIGVEPEEYWDEYISIIAIKGICPLSRCFEFLQSPRPSPVYLVLHLHTEQIRLSGNRRKSG